MSAFGGNADIVRMIVIQVCNLEMLLRYGNFLNC
jgi:hypothetical protein